MMLIDDINATFLMNIVFDGFSSDAHRFQRLRYK